MPLSDLPNEVLLAIIVQVDITGIFSFRKTCRRIHNLTKDRLVWRNILLQKCPLSPTEERLSEISVQELEQLAVRLVRIDKHWLKERIQPARIIHSDDTLLVEMFAGRWLLIVSSEGKVECQDLLMKTCTSLQLRGSPWNSCAARLCEGDRFHVLLAVTAITQMQRTPVTAIVKVQLSQDTVSIEHIGGFVAQFPANVQVFGSEDSEDLIGFTRGCFIDIVNWRTKAHVTIAAHTNELDELWNGIIGIRFCGRFLLCIKVRTIELYEIPPVEEYGPFPPNDRIHAPDLVNPLGMHRFPDNNFRHVAFSEYTPPGGIRVLLSDVLQGLYLFDIQIRPMFGVSLVGKRSLSSKEGFVGAFALGRFGKRGVWVERKRSDTQRSVIAFNAPDASPTQAHNDGDGDLKSGVVYDVKSYDLREDFVNCSLSESNGRIVLTKRCGDIVILDCWSIGEIDRYGDYLIWRFDKRRFDSHQ